MAAISTAGYLRNFTKDDFTAFKGGATGASGASGATGGLFQASEEPSGPSGPDEPGNVPDPTGPGA